MSDRARTPIADGNSDRIPSSTDYAFGEIGEAAAWFDRASISEVDRRKIGRLNAEKLFKLAG